jgi:hypothetical protein
MVSPRVFADDRTRREWGHMPASRKWFAIIVLALAQFIMVLDSTVMNV